VWKDTAAVAPQLFLATRIQIKGGMMLSKKENLLETIRGGTPDRFVAQYEPFALPYAIGPLNKVSHPVVRDRPWKNAWGVTQIFPEGAPGIMPVHTADTIVLKDISRWQDYVTAPSLDFPESAWEAIDSFAAGVDRSDQFLTLAMFPGLLEQLHHMMSMEEAMMAFYSDPDEVKELIDFLVDWEIRYAGLLIERINPDALFHHDDWGSMRSTLISPEMFAEFFIPAYRKLYGFYRENGIELIIHHSDSYAQTLVPAMVALDIDIWQGVATTNDIPAMIAEFGGQISFMGGLDSGVIDRHDWTEDLVRAEVERAVHEGGRHYFIPCLTQGGPMSTFPGVYEAVSREIERVSAELF
jgi:hypothetical protein